MMGILCFDKPKKVRSTEEHNEMFQSDSGIAGTYVPNMSKDDAVKWKAKHVKGEHERIEIKKTIGGVNLNIFVYKEAYQPKYPDYQYDSQDWRTKMNDYYNRHMNVDERQNKFFLERI